MQLTLQPAAGRKARSALCVQVYFTQSVLRMKTTIRDKASPQHQHALPPHNRGCVCFICVCVCYEVNIQIAKTEAVHYNKVKRKNK